ncbi:MAG TPA: cytochrome d ubiquinol oxidase subunit II [Candidatus Saccharimonadales bacterium]|jgi:cytochrome d ubiquinol oxidase subunit II|nr:cytochrome d ubiquinol oxidase subunit II [Candidatus Saccharimonadales bacterium]
MLLLWFLLVAIMIVWPALVLATVISLWATLAIRPELLQNYRQFPLLYGIPVAGAASLGAMYVYQRRSAEKAAFLSSCAYLVFMLVGAAAGVYPNLLTSTTSAALNITVYNAASGMHSLSVGLVWWSFGMALALGYFVFVYRMFKGKVVEGGGHV